MGSLKWGHLPLASSPSPSSYLLRPHSMLSIMALSVLQTAFQTASAWTINVPSSCPSNAAGPIDPTFQAFAFEIASFAQYAQSEWPPVRPPVHS